MLSWSRRRGLAYHTAPARWHAGIGIVRGKQPEWIALAQQVVGIDNVIHTRLQTQYNRLRSVRTYVCHLARPFLGSRAPRQSWPEGQIVPASLPRWHIGIVDLPVCSPSGYNGWANALSSFRRIRSAYPPIRVGACAAEV